MLAINAAPGRELPPPPWPRLRPAVGLLAALGVLGYYGSKIGQEAQPQVMINTDAPAVAGPVPELVLESSTSRDFQIVVRTGVCTTVEYGWEGPGSRGDGAIATCVSAHILSPPPSEALQPGSDYLVTATFTSADGAQSSFERLISTASDN